LKNGKFCGIICLVGRIQPGADNGFDLWIRNFIATRGASGLVKRCKKINAKPKAFARIANMFDSKFDNPMASVVKSVLFPQHGNRMRETVINEVPELALINC